MIIVINTWPNREGNGFFLANNHELPRKSWKFSSLTWNISVWIVRITSIYLMRAKYSSLFVWQAQTVNICTGKYADGHVTVLGAVCFCYSWTDFVIEGNGSVDAISRFGNDVRGLGRRCLRSKRSKILVRNKSGLLFDVCSINSMRFVRDGSLPLPVSLTFTLLQTAIKTQ